MDSDDEHLSAPFRDPVLRLGRNERGRDLVVGDVHGSFDLVLRAMDRLRFDPAADRLLSLGDLIDRGPASHRVSRFLAQPYVHAVRGNHEDLLLQAYADGEPLPGILEFLGCRNGFDWWLRAPDRVRADVLAAVRPLPLAIEVETEAGPVGLVHADVPDGLSWSAFLARLESGDRALAHEALWGRARLAGRDASGVAGVARVFVGHTILDRPTRLGNVLAVDTGAYRAMRGGPGGLVVADATAPDEAFDRAALGADGVYAVESPPAPGAGMRP